MVFKGQPSGGSLPQLVVYDLEDEDPASPTSPVNPQDEVVPLVHGVDALQAIPLPGEVAGEGAVPVRPAGEQGEAFFDISFLEDIICLTVLCILDLSVGPSEVVMDDLEGGGECEEASPMVDETNDVEEVRGEPEKRSRQIVRGEPEKRTPQVDTPMRSEEVRDESSLGPMSLSSSGSMPPLESFTGSPTFITTLQDPAIARLVAEAFRLGQENMAGGEHSLRPANSLLRSLATSLGDVGSGMGGACAVPTTFTTPTPPASTSTPLSAGGSGGGGAEAAQSTTSPLSASASGAAGDTISTASKSPSC